MGEGELSRTTGFQELSRMQLYQALDLHLGEGVPMDEVAGLLGIPSMALHRAVFAEMKENRASAAAGREPFVLL